MAVYVVTWDLNKEKPNYAEARKQFIAHLERYDNTKDPGLDSVRFVSERYDNTKDPGLDSVRFVSTNLSASELSEDLRKKLDNNDQIIVTKLVSGNYAGWLNKSVWDWINARL
jgi:hypothetical protein